MGKREGLVASIVIPAHNRVDLTRRSLYRWLRQLDCGPYEILVMDDASTEDIPAVIGEVEELTPDSKGVVRYLRLSHGLLMRSPNTAWRTGYEEAKADFIVLSSQDVLVPWYALAGVMHTAKRHKGQRASMIVYWMTEQMMGQLGEHPLGVDLNVITGFPEFWTQITPYGCENGQIRSGGLFVLCTGMSRQDWEWIGFLRDTPYFGMDDRDLTAREVFLGKYPVTVPDMFCIHMWHPKNRALRALITHPGFVYETEAQARLLEPAPPIHEPTPIEQFIQAGAEQVTAQLMGSAEASSSDVVTRGAAPDHVISLFAYIIALLGKRGVHTIGIANDWWADSFKVLASEYGMEARYLQEWGDEKIDAIVSLMVLQRLPTYDVAWQYRNGLRFRARHLLVLVPYKDHFHGGKNILKWDEASLQASVTDTTMTGYLIGIW